MPEMVLCAPANCKTRPDNTSRAAVADWLATDTALKLLRRLARKLKSLACSTTDDLTGEVALALLEHADPPCPTADGFHDWLAAVVKETASRLRNQFLRSYAAPGGDAMEAVVDPDWDEAEQCLENCYENARDMANFLKARAARVRRVLAKLPPAQRAAVRERYFGRGNLAEVARTKGLCDSAVRTNLYRGLRSLKSMVTADGYAMSA
jgi:RNA polymerase sigma factor (sigma-70 family)